MPQCIKKTPKNILQLKSLSPCIHQALLPSLEARNELKVSINRRVPLRPPCPPCPVPVVLLSSPGLRPFPAGPPPQHSSIDRADVIVITRHWYKEAQIRAAQTEAGRRGGREGGREGNEEPREKRLKSAAVAVRWPIRYDRIYVFICRCRDPK